MANRHTFISGSRKIAIALLLMMLLFLGGRLVSGTVFGYEVPITDAARRRDWEEVIRLLQQGADPNETTDLQNYHTALYWALGDGREDMVRLLIQHHVKIVPYDYAHIVTSDWRRKYPGLAQVLDEGIARNTPR